MAGFGMRLRSVRRRFGLESRLPGFRRERKKRGDWPNRGHCAVPAQAGPDAMEGQVAHCAAI